MLNWGIYWSQKQSSSPSSAASSPPPSSSSSLCLTSFLPRPPAPWLKPCKSLSILLGGRQAAIRAKITAFFPRRRRRRADPRPSRWCLSTERVFKRALTRPPSAEGKTASYFFLCPCTKIEIIATDFHEETSWIYRVKEFKAQHLGKMQQILAVYASYYLSAECDITENSLSSSGLLFTSLLFLINSFHFVFIVFNSTSLITPLSLFTPRV